MEFVWFRKLLRNRLWNYRYLGSCICEEFTVWRIVLYKKIDIFQMFLRQLYWTKYLLAFRLIWWYLAFISLNTILEMMPTQWFKWCKWHSFVIVAAPNLVSYAVLKLNFIETFRLLSSLKFLSLLKNNLIVTTLVYHKRDFV